VSETVGAKDAPPHLSNQPTWKRLLDQIDWYDNKSQTCQWWYKTLKLVQISIAVSIPLMSQLPWDYAKWITSIGGSLIAIIEGIQHMNQYSTLWVTYRSTAERLKHEKYLFLGQAGPFRGLDEESRLVLLAERVEEHVSTEHANWFNETQQRLKAIEKSRAA
jgi:hypothetical protein